ncbi:hypothetical protein [Motilimonas cestriensis]|uniref:hypothetical protein n=1 Tax=Motilimonas cestriensis TaxID=2742685 RepID=UPI003DA5FD00
MKFNPKYLGILFVVLSLLPTFWLDSVDPAFISSSLFKLMETKIFPMISIILAIIFIILIEKKKRKESKYKEYLERNFIKNDKLALLTYICTLPLINYLFLWLILFKPSIELYGYYFSHFEWEAKYEVVDVSSCGKISQYGSGCSFMTVTSKENMESYTFRWYEGNHLKMDFLKYLDISLVGRANMFGYYADEIDW